MAGYALPAELDERQVIAEFQRDERDGFDLLYRRYAVALTAFCERRLGNRTEAEDAAHDALLKAQRALPRFRDGARLWPWLATIAANVCTDVQRTRDRSQPVDALFDRAGGDVDEDAERRTRTRIVDAALDELPERFRVPLVLREFGGWSYEDIADFSGKSVGSVRTTLTRARRALQCRVEDVARRQGQWPLPAVLGTKWRELRETVRGWRDAVALRSHRAAGAAFQADGMAALMAGGVHVVVAAMAAMTTLGMLPAAASIGLSTEGAAVSIAADVAMGGLGGALRATGDAGSVTGTTQAQAELSGPEAPDRARWSVAKQVDTPAGAVATDTGSSTETDGDGVHHLRVVATIRVGGVDAVDYESDTYGDCRGPIGERRCVTADAVVELVANG